MRLKDIKKIGILGVGFMGGSLALALRKEFPSLVIQGYARSQKSYRKIKRLKILDRIDTNLKKFLEDLDAVVLALPVEAIVKYLAAISPFLKKGAVVFDLGSSKKLIEQTASRILPRQVDFVGCHPLCGSEKSGAEFSCQNLYRGAVCLITAPCRRQAAQTVKKLWERLGCRVVFVNPDFHDRVLSRISHLPHLISFSLTRFIPESFLKFSSASLRDLTRISNSPAAVWADIFISNQANLSRDLTRFIKTLRQFGSLLKAKDKKKITALINKVNAKQEHIV